MGIDSSIALQGKPSVQLLNPIDVQQQAMTMQRLAQQNQVHETEMAQASSMRDILKKNVDTDANGKSTLNQSAVLSDLYKTNPAKAMEYQKAFQAQNLDQLKNEHELKKSLVFGMNDEPSYMQGRQKAIELGLPNAEKLPEQYPGQQYIASIQKSTLDHGEQLKEKEYEMNNAYKKDEIAVKKDAVGVQSKHYQMMYADHADARAEKQESKQSDYYQKASKDLETFKGNAAVQQANTALTNVSNAMSLADKGNLSTDQLHLFSSEMAKLATGGVPGHAEIEAMMPNTMQSKLAKAASFFSNSPTDAQAQEFINNNKPYLKELMKNYGDVVDRYRESTLDGYSKKLSPEYIQELKDRNAKSSYKTRMATDVPALQPPAAGMIRMKDPNGKFRDVRPDQVGEAVAAGGTKI